MMELRLVHHITPTAVPLAASQVITWFRCDNQFPFRENRIAMRGQPLMIISALFTLEQIRYIVVQDIASTLTQATYHHRFFRCDVVARRLRAVRFDVGSICPNAATCACLSPKLPNELSRGFQHIGARPSDFDLQLLGFALEGQSSRSSTNSWLTRSRC